MKKWDADKGGHDDSRQAETCYPEDAAQQAEDERRDAPTLGQKHPPDSRCRASYAAQGRSPPESPLRRTATARHSSCSWSGKPEGCAAPGASDHAIPRDMLLVAFP